MRPIFVTVAIGLSLSDSLPARAGEAKTPTIEELLSRMIRASRTLNMRGTQIILNTRPHMPTRPLVIRVVRRRDGKSLARVVEPAASKGAAAYDDGQWIYRYDPAQQRVYITRSLPAPTDEQAIRRRVRIIKRNYMVNIIGTEYIAGRLCYALRLEPRNKIDYPLTVWLDAKNGAVLWRQESDRAGNTLGLLMYTSVEFPTHIADSELHLSLPTRTRKIIVSRSPALRSIESLRRYAGFDITLPISMPCEYEFENGEVVMVGGCRTVCLRYTNGITRLTIYQAPVVIQRAESSLFIRSWQLPLGEGVVNRRYGPMNYLVVGHCDLQGLLHVAIALDRRRAHAHLNELARTFRVPSGILANMRNHGMSLDAIAALLDIHSQTGRSLEGLFRLYQEGWSWSSMARQFRADLTRVTRRAQSMGER
jgi:hypothetical protein